MAQVGFGAGLHGVDVQLLLAQLDRAPAGSAPRERSMTPWNRSFQSFGGVSVNATVSRPSVTSADAQSIVISAMALGVPARPLADCCYCLVCDSDGA